MTMPETPTDQVQSALEQAWAAAAQAMRLLDQNNLTTAVAWATTSQAWSSLALAVTVRRP